MILNKGISCKCVHYVLIAQIAVSLLYNTHVQTEITIRLNDNVYNDTWMYMPDGNGEPQIAYLTEPPIDDNHNLSSTILFEYHVQWIVRSFKIKWLIDDTNTTNRLRIIKNDVWDQIIKDYNPAHKTKILVHGWKSSTQSDSILLIKNAYLKKGRVNVFAVNWREQAENIYYLKPARYTPQVGRAIAQLINYLVEEKRTDADSIHLIGHSLGAHIMGYAGSFSKYRVGRITGLDPARPAFENCIGAENHLDHTDAKFVDIIHSCAGVLGFKKPIGHIDFYPNGGAPPQPGCSELTQVFAGCSHGRSYVYYAESINNLVGFYASRCNSLIEVHNRNCSGIRTLMGEQVSLKAHGIFYLETNSEPPFALGE